MIRPIIFSIYGGAVGGIYAWVLTMLLDGSFVVGTICIGILVPACGYIGFGVGQQAKLSALQQFAMIALAPLAFVASVFGLCFFFGMVAFVSPIFAVRSVIQERRFRSRMIQKGRYSSFESIRNRLIQGEGTLIEETGGKGPFHVWWTEDDLLESNQPTLSPDEFVAVLYGETIPPFNSHCLNDYLDEEHGKALLTSIPPRLAASGELARMFPKMKRATVIRPVNSAL